VTSVNTSRNEDAVWPTSHCLLGGTNEFAGSTNEFAGGTNEFAGGTNEFAGGCHRLQPLDKHHCFA